MFRRQHLKQAWDAAQYQLQFKASMQLTFDQWFKLEYVEEISDEERLKILQEAETKRLAEQSAEITNEVAPEVAPETETKSHSII